MLWVYRRAVVCNSDGENEQNDAIFSCRRVVFEGEGKNEGNTGETACFAFSDAPYPRARGGQARIVQTHCLTHNRGHICTGRHESLSGVHTPTTHMTYLGLRSASAAHRESLSKTDDLRRIFSSKRGPNWCRCLWLIGGDVGG